MTDSKNDKTEIEKFINGLKNKAKSDEIFSLAREELIALSGNKIDEHDIDELCLFLDKVKIDKNKLIKFIQNETFCKDKLNTHEFIETIKHEDEKKGKPIKTCFTGLLDTKKKRELTNKYNKLYKINEWITNILASHSSNIKSFVPTDEQVVLFNFLSLEFSPKCTLKNAFDNGLSLLKEHVISKYSEQGYALWKNQIGRIKQEFIEQYAFFKDLMSKESESRVKKIKEIDKQYSKYKKREKNSFISKLKEISKIEFIKVSVSPPDENTIKTVNINYSSKFKKDSTVALEISNDEKYNLYINYPECNKEQIYDVFADDLLGFANSEVIEISKLAVHGSVVTHGAKFSHPAALTPKLYIDGKNRTNDGFLRTGNNEVGFDLHINSTYLKVYEFLSLQVGKHTVLEHIKKEDGAKVISLFVSDKADVEAVLDNFNVCINAKDERTNQLIKQIYFQKNEGHDLLSVVFPSGLAFELKKQINVLKFSDQSKVAKRNEKNAVIDEFGYKTIKNITLQRYGGDHPKNISALNNKYQDVLLLDSCPPILFNNDRNLPKKDFYTTLWRKNYLGQLYGFHRVLRAEKEQSPQKRSTIINSFLERNGQFKEQLIRYSKADVNAGILPHHLKVLMEILLTSFVDQVIESICLIRCEQEGWSNSKKIKDLPQAQKILLDQAYASQRTEEWFTEVNEKLTFWFIDSYKKELKDNQLGIKPDLKQKIIDTIQSKKEWVL